MALVVGTNAYADVSEYDELIASRFMSTNAIRVFWEGLNNSDKECLIVGNTLKYDKEDMCYKGFKEDINQTLQFPRVNVYGATIDCPDDIKLGIVLQGIEDSMSEGTTEAEMIKNGVKSFTDGTGAKIEFMDSSSISGNITRTSTGMYRTIYSTYFKPYTDLI